MAGGDGPGTLVKLHPSGQPFIPVHNLLTGQHKDVALSRLLPVLDRIGQRTDSAIGRVVLAGPSQGIPPALLGPGTLLVGNHGQSDFVWQEIQKKGPDSYPPVSPRELGNYFARLANAKNEESYQRTLAELGAKVEYWRNLDDSHSVRYLENAIGLVEARAGGARTWKAAYDEEREKLRDLLNLDLDQLKSKANDSIRRAEDRAERRIDELQRRLDWTDFRTLARYAIPVLAGTAVAMYETLSHWLAAWPLAGKGGLVAAAAGLLAGGAWWFRNRVRRLVREAGQALDDLSSQVRQQSGDEQKALLTRHHARLLDMGAQWARFIAQETLEVTLICFNVAMDFFPTYVRSEMANLGMKWNRDFKGQKRERALAILKAGLSKPSVCGLPGPGALVASSPDSGALAPAGSARPASG